MRPQRNAAENVKVAVKHPLIDVASMRPQRNAAENSGETQIGRAHV